MVWGGEWNDWGRRWDDWGRFWASQNRPQSSHPIVSSGGKSMEEARYVIRKVGKADITDCVSVIRRSFRTVAEEFGFTEENAPGFTAFSTTEEKVLYWMTEQHRSMYGCFKEEQLVGYYNLLPTENGYELGSLSVLPEYRHAGIGRILLTDAMIRVAAEGAGRMEISIVEENTILRKWYESMGFLHTGTKKFDFFPFTVGYMERDLKAGPLRLEKLMISRGHIILWLEQAAASAPRFVYISGELTMNGRFYTDLFREWYWVEKPEGSVYFLDNLTVLGTVTDEEKLQIIIAANERNKADQENVQIIYEPVNSPRVVRVSKMPSSQQEKEEFPIYEHKCKSSYFYGISGKFSTKNGEQYQTIGAFWDEMSAKHGRENLQGMGYLWDGDTMSYAIGLKDGRIEDYDVEIWLPEEGWKAVKGRTEELSRIYDRIYRDGSLTYEIETFTPDGDCEICFYRIGDDWMDAQLEVGTIFDTAKCTVYYRPKEPDKMILISNFRYTGDSSIKWWDEASYGMCTHPCTKEEIGELYHILKDIPPDEWRFSSPFRHVRVTEEIKQKALEILRQMCFL